MNGRHVIYTGEFPDGSELMVEHWPDGKFTAATKPPPGTGWGVRVWGPPITLEEDE